MTEIPCFKCGSLFEQKPRNPTHYCKPCRVARNREKTRLRNQRKIEFIQEAVSSLPPASVLSFDDAARELGPMADDRTAIVNDRQPAGWKSAKGSSDGRSTYFKDLAGVLDTLEEEATAHSWWAEHPHWNIAL